MLLRAHPRPAPGPLVPSVRSGSGLPLPPCFADADRGPPRLMRVGLALILVGHVNLLLGAVLHGTVLRHVANPRGAVTPEYTTANIISVGSGLLVSAVGTGRGWPGGWPQRAARASSFCLPECFPGTCGPLGIQEPSSPTTGEGISGTLMRRPGIWEMGADSALSAVGGGASENNRGVWSVGESAVPAPPGCSP